MTAASDALEPFRRIAEATRLVAEDSGLTLERFAIDPNLQNPELNQITIALLYDPDNETKPKLEILQLEGAVDEGLSDARAQQLKDAQEKARREIAKALEPRGDIPKELRDKLGGRGGFLDQGE
jgi:hypothetical protein